MFDQEILDAIKKHARQEYPKECCGIITDEGYVPLENIHETPETNFKLPDRIFELLVEDKIKAIVHSHPDGPFGPSIYDQAQQAAFAMPWGLVVLGETWIEEPFFWGDGIPEQPLIGRDFRWGPTGTDCKGDCGALVKDYYRQFHGFTVEDGARDKDWLERNPTFYTDTALNAGFKYIDPHDMQVGDLCFFAVQSRGRPNHAGVIYEPGLVLHHIEGRLSRLESFLHWRGSCVGIMRPPLPRIK